MRPISSRFLKSEITLYKKTGEDDYGRPAYDEGTTVSRVFVAAPKEAKQEDLGETAADRLEIFHDNRKSTAATYEKGDKVEYKGEEYYVRKADLLPTPDDPHHWEVKLT